VERTVEPFKNAAVAIPPRELWHKVKSRIEDSVREDYFDLSAVLSFFAPKWASVAALVSMVFFHVGCRNYLAHNIWSKFAQQGVTAEESDTLALAYLNDVQGEQAKNIFQHYRRLTT